MFDKKLREEVKKIKVELIGYPIYGNSFKRPAPYSVLYKVRALDEEVKNQRMIIDMLLDELGYSIEEGLRITKKKKGK